MPGQVLIIKVTFKRNFSLNLLLHHSPVLREDVDCGRVVSTVRQVQGAELGHQVHETASHTLLVLGEPMDANTPATLSLSICTLQLQHSQVSAQEPPTVRGHSQVTA